MARKTKRGKKLERRNEKRDERKENRGERKENRKERKDERKENRGERKEERKENRGERKEERRENREERKENREERREEIKETLKEIGTEMIQQGTEALGEYIEGVAAINDVAGVILDPLEKATGIPVNALFETVNPLQNAEDMGTLLKQTVEGVSQKIGIEDPIARVDRGLPDIGENMAFRGGTDSFRGDEYNEYNNRGNMDNEGKKRKRDDDDDSVDISVSSEDTVPTSNRSNDKKYYDTECREKKGCCETNTSNEWNNKGNECGQMPYIASCPVSTSFCPRCNASSECVSSQRYGPCSRSCVTEIRFKVGKK